MKKSLSALCALLLLLLSAFPAAAAGITLKITPSATEVTEGQTVTYTIALGGSCTAKSGSVEIDTGDAFEVVSGEFCKTGAMLSNFDTATNLGALAFKDETDLSGNYFKLVLKAKTASTTAQSVRVSVTLKSGKTVVGSAEDSVSVKVTCKNHAFGSYTKLNDSQHRRTCSACGYAETSGHTWNGGTVTKAATCKETGSREFSCTVCKATKTESIAKTNTHTFGSYTVTKQPTCTAAGTQTRTCSVCGKTETQSVPATGHSMGAWTQTKAPTCTEQGEETRSCGKCGHSETKAIAALGHSFSSPKVTKEPTCTESGIEEGKCSRCGQTTTNTIRAKGHQYGAWTAAKAATCTEGGTEERKCSACGAAESRATKALGHDFENPTVVKEATISETGLKEGKCRRCGETTSEVIPCSAEDANTGTRFEADEGVFRPGTAMGVEKVSEADPTYASAKNVLRENCEDFTLYDIIAKRDGEDVQPNGKVRVTLTVPDGYGADAVLYRIGSDGQAVPIEAEFSADGKTLSAELTELGLYAIGKLGGSTATTGSATAPTSSTAPSVLADAPEQTGSFPWGLIAAVAAVLVIGGAIVLIVILKKKKAA